MQLVPEQAIPTTIRNLLSGHAAAFDYRTFAFCSPVGIFTAVPLDFRKSIRTSGACGRLWTGAKMVKKGTFRVSQSETIAGCQNLEVAIPRKGDCQLSPALLQSESSQPMTWRKMLPSNKPQQHRETTLCNKQQPCSQVSSGHVRALASSAAQPTRKLGNAGAVMDRNGLEQVPAVGHETL